MVLGRRGAAVASVGDVVIVDPMGSGHVPEFIGGGAPLEVQVTPPTDGIARVVPRGEIDRETGPRLAGAVKAAVSDGAERIDLDMSEVTFMDSQGLRTLFEVSRDDEVRVVDPSPQVASLLRLTGVAEHFGVDP